MPHDLTLPLWLCLAGVALLLAGTVAVRRSGAQASLARHLAGARQRRVGELLGLAPGEALPERPIRVAGRVRCQEPIVTDDGDRLVAFHRDVEVEDGHGTWRSIERTRETRSFELWDHDGSLSVDPAAAAEPIIVLPHVWAGTAADLDASYAPALARVTAEHGEPVNARGTTRMVNVIDRLLVLAIAQRDAAGAIVLAPPRGGYIISALELDDAMRLLGGPDRRLLLAGVGGIVMAIVLLAASALLAIVNLAG
jgi:hypothetical protein